MPQRQSESKLDALLHADDCLFANRYDYQQRINARWILDTLSDATYFPVEDRSNVPAAREELSSSMPTISNGKRKARDINGTGSELIQSSKKSRLASTPASAKSHSSRHESSSSPVVTTTSAVTQSTMWRHSVQLRLRREWDDELTFDKVQKATKHLGKLANAKLELGTGYLRYLGNGDYKSGIYTRLVSLGLVCFSLRNPSYSYTLSLACIVHSLRRSKT